MSLDQIVGWILVVLALVVPLVLLAVESARCGTYRRHRIVRGSAFRTLRQSRSDRGRLQFLA